jgi:hypothetical protein
VRVVRALSARPRADRASGARFLFVGLSAARCATRFVVAAALGAVGLILAIVPMTAAHADAGSPLVALTNQARAIEGLAPLADNASLTAVAQAQAARMAASNVLQHNPNLSTDICCWTSLGENVGYGGSITILESAFLASPDHRANIMGHYNQIGIGVVTDSHGLVWVSEVFRLTAGASVPAPVTPKPAPSTSARAASSRPVRVLMPTRTALHPVMKPKPSPVATPVATVAVAPLAARTVPSAASRSLPSGRLPLVAARAMAARWAAFLRSPSAAVSDPADPVASVLSFAAQTAASAS